MFLSLCYTLYEHWKQASDLGHRGVWEASSWIPHEKIETVSVIAQINNSKGCYYGHVSLISINIECILNTSVTSYSLISLSPCFHTTQIPSVLVIYIKFALFIIWSACSDWLEAWSPCSAAANQNTTIWIMQINLCQF